jgi:hypothetical protein
VLGALGLVQVSALETPPYNVLKRPLTRTIHEYCWLNRGSDFYHFAFAVVNRQKRAGEWGYVEL